MHQCNRLCSLVGMTWVLYYRKINNHKPWWTSARCSYCFRKWSEVMPLVTSFLRVRSRLLQGIGAASCWICFCLILLVQAMLPSIIFFKLIYLLPIWRSQSTIAYIKYHLFMFLNTLFPSLNLGYSHLFWRHEVTRLFSVKRWWKVK